MANIGFVGLGNMGKPMVKQLINAGHHVTIHDINPDAKQALALEGAFPVENAGDVAKDADFVFTMLQTGEQVHSVCLGKQGIFASIPEGAVYIDSSSIDITSSRELHKIAKEKNIPMLDAPVSGGTLGAANASLTFMVGGNADTLERAMPIFQTLGQRIVHTGPEGNGQAAKICNNMILGITMIGVSEAFTLGENLGLSPEKLFEVTSNASGSCWSLLTNCPVPHLTPNSPSNKNYQAGFSAYMMLKDLRNSQEAANASHTNTPLGAQATQLYETFNKMDHYGDLDFCAIIKLLQSHQL